MMLEEIQRRNYAHRTAKTYVRIVHDFANHFHCSPNRLGPEHIRQYQAHLFQTKKLSPATVSQYASALRFFFVKTLRRHFLAEHIPFPKPRRRLPSVLSREEVATDRLCQQSLSPHPAHDLVLNWHAPNRTLSSEGP
jgi:site-specific recombinase XerD